MKAVEIRLWDKIVGNIIWNKEQGVASFQYDNNFLSSKLEISPIIMPLKYNDRIYSFPENKNKCFKGLPGAFADSVPDDFGCKIIESWFNLKKNLQEITPLDYLCYIGTRSMGALEFFPILTKYDTSTEIEIKEIRALTNILLNDREKFSVNLQEEKGPIIDLLKIGTSAGGAKPKVLVAFNPETKEMRSGQVKAPSGFNYYLLKFDGVEDKKISDNPIGIGNIEHAYYKMALDCDIHMMPSILYKNGEYNHFMTQRFDRTNSGEKLHIQTLAAIAHLNRDIPQSYESAFRVIRLLNLPQKASDEMFTRMVFNVIARNHDDHTKNHSFIMDKTGKWSLAPAYDLCYSYSPSGMWTSVHQMSINNKRSEFTYNDLFETGKKNDIKNPREIIERVSDVISNWLDYAKESEVKRDHAKQIEKNLIKLHIPLHTINTETFFLSKVKNNELKQIIKLKNDGFKPSKESIKKINQDPLIAENTKIAINKIFELDDNKQKDPLSNVKLSKNDNVKKNNNKSMNL